MWFDRLGFAGWELRSGMRRYFIAEAHLVPFERRADALPRAIAELEVPSWMRDRQTAFELYEIAARLNRAPPPSLDLHAADALVRQVIGDALRYGSLLLFEEREAERGPRARPGSIEEPEALEPPHPVDQPVEQKTWIEIRLEDATGQPVKGAKYRIRLPNNELREGALDGAGRARLDGIDPGSCEICFPDVDRREWMG